MTEVEWPTVPRTGLVAVLGFVIGRARRVLGDPIRSRTVALAAATAPP